MGRLTFFVVFFSGIACAIVFTFLSHLIGNNSESVWKTKLKQKAFTAIPEDQIDVSDDIHLEVALRGASDMNVPDINRNTGNYFSNFKFSQEFFLVQNFLCDVTMINVHYIYFV